MSRTRRPPRPLDPRRLEEMALAYVARFATTRARLEDYLARKLRERGWDDGAPYPDIAALARRFESAGYIDDEAYARARAGSLLRRGYGKRRVGQALGAAGIDETLRAAVAPGEGEARAAALAMARKRRFGPFASEPLDRPQREKQIAAMLRAGHSFDHARALLDEASEQDALDWAQAEGSDELWGDRE
jgi:regulatory protein